MNKDLLLDLNAVALFPGAGTRGKPGKPNFEIPGWFGPVGNLFIPVGFNPPGSKIPTGFGPGNPWKPRYSEIGILVKLSLGLTVGLLREVEKRPILL